MKKPALIFSIFLLIGALNINSYGKEGMYLPMLLKKINASEMEAMGMRITPDEIYSVNQPSLKDAIVHFGGGCTAEIVSDQGLLFTNHHCGYRSIQRHSTINYDYLTDGFWAKDFSDELPNPGLTATILQSMTDVTKQVLDGVKPEMSESERQAIIIANINKLTNSDDKKHVKLEIKAFYYGNQYILMHSIVFSDVRLVGAPPSNIGKFGGDTDNWMWPRHTGDFSVFRIYANNNNQPADYSLENIPYKPVKYLDINIGGYDKGDFTFVFGYPGFTEEYIPSMGVSLITSIVNPFKIDLRRQKLDIMANYMEKDPQIRIQYSAKYAGVANGWKKWIGENRGIKKLKTVNRKQIDEAEFSRWAKAQDPKNANLISTFTNTYNNYTPYELAFQYFIEAGYYEELIRYAYQYNSLVKLCESKDPDQKKLDEMLSNLSNGIVGFYRDYTNQVENELLVASLNAYSKFPYPSVPIPDAITMIQHKYSGNTQKYVDYIFKKSLFADKAKLEKFISAFKTKDVKKLKKDPLFILANSVYNNFYSNIQPSLFKYQSTIDSLQRIYMEALIKMENGQYLFPDANSTLRVSYGIVDSYEPRDGVEYLYFTTLEGIMDKENPNIYDYVVEPKLKKLYQAKDYGPYKDKDGTMHTCFIASNHTTGGNSGSPVLNAQGQLIGLNFDRDWEGTMSDLDYDPELCRNIILDIRYCLFIIDKFAESHRLIEELNIVQ